MTLTKRQKKILGAIIYEFMKTASPVGSLTLSDKYKIGVSPATLRMEMAKLVNQGYLRKEHSSAGRLPTSMGLRFFIDKILKEKEDNSLEKTRFKEKIFRTRFNRSRFIREAVNVLSDITGIAAISMVDDIFYATGISKLMNQPEFEDLRLLQDAVNILESDSTLGSIFDKYAIDNTLRTLIGEEIGMQGLSRCSLVFSPFKYFRGSRGYIAVIGPLRMRYSKVIPAVRGMANFIEDSIRGWE